MSKMKTFDKHALDLIKLDTSMADHIDDLIAEKKFNLDDDILSDPQTRKLALIRLGRNHKIDLAYALIQKFNMDRIDNAIIYHILSYMDATLLKTFMDLDFKFESEMFNPFALILWIYNQDERFVLNMAVNIPFAQTHETKEIIEVFKLLVNSGYNIHADDNLVIRFCFQPQILSFCLLHGCNIHHCDIWIKNYIEFFGGNFINFPLKSIKLLIRHGMDLHEHGELLIMHAIETADYDLMKLLINNNINITPYLQSNIKILGNKFSIRKEIYGGQIGDLINLLIANDCDLSLINPSFIHLISVKGYHKVLEIFIKNGVNIADIIRSAKLIKTDNHTNPMYHMVKIYINLGFTWEEIFDLLFSNRIDSAISLNNQSN